MKRKKLHRRYGRSADIASVPADVRARALRFATLRYESCRDLYKLGPKAAYHKTWNDLHRAAYGTDSTIGFIRYAHQIGEIVHEAQTIVEAERKSHRRSR